MVSNDELLIKNSLLLIYVRENKPVAEKVVKVRSCLEEGADVNTADGNDGGNTALHVVARRGEGPLLELLLNKGAQVTRTNSHGQTPLDIARQLHEGKEIVKILETAESSANDSVSPNTDRLPTPSEQNNQVAIPSKSYNAQPEFKYLKRAGTSGVCGQLYETKLLSLVLLRALNDGQIEHFLLGTNIRGIGDLDDICLRYRVRDHNRPVVLFVQAKHREDREKGRLTVEDVQSASGDFSLRKYFESYLTIKERFHADDDDPMFEGDFDNVECNLVIYTPAKDCFTKKNTNRQASKKVHYLINTGVTTEVFQYDYDEEDVENLTKMTVIERFKKLGAVFIEMIMSEKDKSEIILAVELIARYHVVMGREVLQQSKVQPANQEYYMWEFRAEFFDSDCEYLVALQRTFVKELSAKRCDQSKITNEDLYNIKLVLEDPCATTISKVIGKLATYNDKTRKLQLIEVTTLKKKFKTDEFKALLKQFNAIEITENVINEAVRIKLVSMKIKLPLSFGNLDMTFRGSEAKVQRRIKAVADKIVSLLELNKETKVIDINDDVVGPGRTIEQGILDINGGIGSAVGNLLILDTDTNMLKFDLDNDTLPHNAALFLKELKDKLVNGELSSYRIKININGFPKDSFNGDEYDKRQARDYLSKLWFYANQAKEDEVEGILKDDINKLYNKEKDGNQFKFKIHSDAIFLRSHDEIQKWWMETGEVRYLNRTSDLFEQAKQAVIDNPLLTVLNFMYNLKINNIGIQFSEEVIEDLNLDNITEKLYNVISNANVLTGIKIIQHFEKQDRYSFIDFDYVLSLPLNDYNTMRQELQKTNIETLIIVYEKLKHYEGFCNKFKEVIHLFKGNRIVVVTDEILAEEIKKYAREKYRSVRDDKTYLIDLTESSQAKILKESKIVFQGEELPLESVLDGHSRNFVRTEMFQKLINKEKHEIGHSLSDKNYNEITDFISRSLSVNDDTYTVETLQDIKNDVVVVSGRPGMGKSALLTHLSVNTKRIDPMPWIVRLNLPDYEKEFIRWQEHNLTIDLKLLLHFLCTIALKNFNTQMQIEFDYFSDSITISHVKEDIDPLALFELELFLYVYHSGNIVFLFDDFNAICPHYETEVLQMLMLLKKERKQMWITTCPYKHTKTPLENEFGTPFKLDPFRTEEKKAYLERFFRTNLKLEKLNYDQFENVRSFLKYMSNVTNMRVVSDPDREMVPLFSLLFHMLYVMAVKFFKSEINRASAATLRAKFRENFEIDLDQYSPVDEILGRMPDDEDLELSGTPLHLYIAANYFRFRIEESLTFPMGAQEARNKWNLMLNSITLYQHYIEAHIRRIFYKQDDDDDSVVSTFRETRKDFLDKHKKLGLFTICRENDMAKFLRADEINEIQTTISKIQSGEYRSSLVNCVVNEVPRFAHLVFAEYFAVEFLTDLMKEAVLDNDVLNVLKKPAPWQSILNILLFNAPPGVRKAFDYKLQTDSSLAQLTKNELVREVVFELLLKQDKRESEREGERSETPITDALEDGCMNIVKLLLSSAQMKLNRGDVDDVIGLFKRTKEKLLEFGEEYADIIMQVFDSVMKMEFDKLGDMFNRLTEVPVRHANDYCSSETGSELQRHIVATTSNIPLLAQNIRQVCEQTGNLKETVINLAELGVMTVLDHFLDKLKEPESDLDLD